MGKNINQNNMTKLGLEHLKSFATRGVFIDLVKVYQQANKLKSNPNCRTPCIDKGTVITAEDLQAGLKLTNTTLREGDVVILHTGWGDLFLQHPAKNTEYNSGEAGHRQGCREMADRPEDRGGRRRQLGRRGDPRREPGRSVHRSIRCCSPTTASTSSRTCGPI